MFAGAIKVNYTRWGFEDFDAIYAEGRKFVLMNGEPLQPSPEYGILDGGGKSNPGRVSVQYPVAKVQTYTGHRALPWRNFRALYMLAVLSINDYYTIAKWEAYISCESFRISALSCVVSCLSCVFSRRLAVDLAFVVTAPRPPIAAKIHYRSSRSSSSEPHISNGHNRLTGKGSPLVRGNCLYTTLCTCIKHA
jgi:hypothetical protein